MRQRIKKVNKSLLKLGLTFEEIQAFWIECITEVNNKL